MPGGVIKPDNRPASTPGVGKRSKRHDLERSSTPGLHGSDLQFGDVSMLEAAQQIAPVTKRVQNRAHPQAPTRNPQGPTQRGDMQVPDPVQFLRDRGRGTLGTEPPVRSAPIDPTPWIPLLRALVNSPGSGGAVAGAMITQLSNIARGPRNVQSQVINLQDLDDRLSAALDAGI